MSGKNKVTVTLDAIDRLTPILKGIQNTTRGLGASAVFMGNMYTSAFQAAASAAGKIAETFNKASDSQESFIKKAGQFGAMTGKDFTSGLKLVDRLTQGVAELGMSLPGTMQDYRDNLLGLTDTLIKVNTARNGIFNEDGLVKQGLSLAQSLTLLQDKATGLDSKDIQRGVTKFVEGASKAELMRLELFQTGVPGLYPQMEKVALRLFGERGKDLSKLYSDERAKVMEIAGQELVPPEMIAALKKTAKQQIQALTESLFNENRGVFGFLRTVKEANGEKISVMDGFAALLTNLIGRNGLLASVGRVLRAFGLSSGDPMLDFYNGLMTLADWAQRAGRFLDTIPARYQRLVQKLGFDPIERLQYGLGVVGGWIDRSNRFLRSLRLPDFSRLSKDGGLAALLSDRISKAFQSIRNSVWSMTNDGTFKGIGKNLGDLFNKGVNFLGELLSNVDWKALGAASGDLAIGAMDILGSLLSNIDWDQLGSFLGVIVKAVFHVLSRASRKIEDYLIDKGLSLVEVGARWAKDRMSELYDAIKNTVAKWISAMSQGFINLPTTQPKQLSPQEQESQQWEVAKGSEAWKSFLALLSGGVIPSNFANGLNVGGLFSAISAESRAMPAGAGIAIANTSETILNRSQQSDLVAAMSRARSSGGVFAPQITVNPSPGMDERSLASMVLAELDARWKQYQLASV